MFSRTRFKKVGLIVLTLMVTGGWMISPTYAASKKSASKTIAPSKTPAGMKAKSNQKFQTQNMKVNPAKVKEIPKSCDLAIVEVITVNCLCRDCLFAQGYLFPTEVKVKVANWGPTTTHGKVTLKYRDINNSLKTRTMSTGMLAKNQVKTLSFFGTVVAKRNYCFKAQIVEATSTMPDTNLSNNNAKNCSCTSIVK